MQLFVQVDDKVVADGNWLWLPVIFLKTLNKNELKCMKITFNIQIVKTARRQEITGKLGLL